MRIVNKMLTESGRKVYYESFNDYREFLNVIKERDRTNAHDRSHKLEALGKDNPSDTGVHSYAEAENLLLNGWDSKLEYFKQKFNEESKMLSEKKAVKSFADVVGFMPIVPNAVMNLPRSMMNQMSYMKKVKVVKFLIDVTYCWGTKTEDVLEQFSKVLARVAMLEKNGFRCRIETFSAYANDDEKKTIVANSILVKSENQLFDLKRMMFPVVHTAMFRVMGFGWENSLPIDYHSYHTWGLGSPLYAWNTRKREELLNALNENGEKLVYLNYKSDIDEVLKEGGLIK